MNSLKEIVQLLTRNKLKAIETLDLTEGSDSKLAALYDVISRGEVRTDQEAEQILYQGADNTSGYRKLKNKLYRKLINSLVLADLNKTSYSDRKSAYYQCYKEWAALRILLAKNAWTTSVEIAERILKYSVKYEFTELTLDLLGILRLHYGTRIGDLRRFEEYKQLFLHYEPLYIAENKAELLYTELVSHYVNDKSTKTNLREKAEIALTQLSDSLQRYTSYRLHFYGGMIRLMISSTVNEHEQTIRTCEDLIRFFGQKPYRAETPLQVAYYQKFVCHCQLRQFEHGRSAAEQCLSLIEEGTVNWFKHYEMYFILAMHTDNYSEALSVFCKVSNHRRFEHLPPNSIEVWHIYEAYLHLLAEFGELPPLKENSALKEFRLGRFLNEAVIYSKDKAGLNISVIIFQICYLIAKEQTGDVIDKAEAIDKYCHRHLSEAHTQRSFYFIRALLTLAAAGNLHEDKRKCQKAQALKALALEKYENVAASQEYQIEIIPFEKLWAMVDNVLQLRSTTKNRISNNKIITNHVH